MMSQAHRRDSLLFEPLSPYRALSLTDHSAMGAAHSSLPIDYLCPQLNQSHLVKGLPKHVAVDSCYNHCLYMSVKQDRKITIQIVLCQLVYMRDVMLILISFYLTDTQQICVQNKVKGIRDVFYRVIFIENIYNGHLSAAARSLLSRPQ